MISFLTSPRGKFEPHELHEELKILPRVLLGRRVAQKIRRMVRAHDLRALVLVNVSAKTTHRLVDAEKIRRRDGAKAADEFRTHDVERRVEERSAGARLRFRRVAVPRRTTSNNVAYKDVGTRQSHSFFDHIREEFAAASDEGLASKILLRAGAFPDKNEFRIRIADAKDGLRTVRDEFRTQLAFCDFRRDRL